MKPEKYMNKKFLAVMLVILSFLYGCSVIEQLRLREPPKEIYEGQTLLPAEGPIPGVPTEVKFADFWIRNAENPDDIMMTPEQIEQFNAENPLKGTYILDVLDLPLESIGDNVREFILANARYLADQNFYVTDDILLERAERQRIIALMDTARVPDIIRLKFGVMLRRVEGKIWPTMIPLMSSPNDNEFDQGMVSALDMGEPVALLHTSRDGRWSYVQHSLFTAWIPSDAVAFGGIETIRTLTDKDEILVAAGHRVSIYGTPEGGAAIGAIQMGSYLRLDAVGNDYCVVLIPARGELGELVVKKGFVRRDSNISIGFLPYTLRNLYRQCFVLYGRRYGWGGMYEGRDCSRFVLDVFRCFGFRLPRNSSRQAEASPAVMALENMSRETKLQALRNSPGGISIVRMPGHIMIYLGTLDETSYFVSDFWAWREPVTENQDITHRTARVAVTGLFLGEGSKRGAFIDRLTHITILGNYVIEGQ
ncbi:hypothetical protein ES707_06815 [subsurface metagenome]